MSHRLRAAVAVASMLASVQALASGADIEFSNFQVSVLDLTGAVNPLSTVVFNGGDSADTELTAFPSDPYPGPPGWTGYQEGVVTSPGAFDTVLSLGEIDDVITYGVDAYFAGIDQPTPGGEVSAAGGDAVVGGGTFATLAKLTLGGSSFVLAPRSELVVSTSLTMGASGGYAGAFFAFAGPQGSSWSHVEYDGSFSDDVSLVFRNDSDNAVTDAFTASFTASSVPEPTTPALLLLGAAALLLQRGLMRRTARSLRAQNE